MGHVPVPEIQVGERPDPELKRIAYRTEKSCTAAEDRGRVFVPEKAIGMTGISGRKYDHNI